MSTVPAEEAYPPAGLERRFLAFTLDRLLAWTAYAGFGWLAWWLAWRDGEVWTGVGVLVGGVVLVAGGLAVLTGLTGLSPGRAATGLRLLDAETEEPLGVGRAVLRAAVLGLATLPTFGFGVATLAWTAVSDPGGRRRGWHDQRAGSVVIDVRPLPEDEEDEGAEVPRQMVNLTALRLVPSAAGGPAGTPAPGTPTPVATPAAEPQQASPAPVHAPAEPSEPTPAEPAPARPTEPPAATPDAPPAPPTPSAPERRTLQAPLRPDPAAPGPAAHRADRDEPGDPADDDAGPAAAPGGTSVAATPRGTAIPPDRPGRHRERGRARGRASTPPPPPQWHVTFDTGESVVVEGVLLVGRRPEPRSGEQVRHVVALTSQDMSLSKTHAQLHLADGVLVVMDRGSTNGSVLMRRGVARDLAANRPTTLVEGDRVRFGDREMRVEKQAGKQA
ncbi:RDD family protein [Nocardioides sp. CFH 31398]|uniref:RDD family protein n=1 Tax=Nocardioides sp. CFH 31398 TaxID=2919579 RepID=UPI001F0584B7|nr:RDD family protein [Nocardioides sp. CFH 31398]MCH1867717.1 RDD family protein [Nocardioides sp. CFH 31398]